MQHRTGSSSHHAFLAFALAIAAACLSPAPGRAQPGPYFASAPEPLQRYELHLSASYRYATRDRFQAPVFLLPQLVSRIEAQELQTALDFRLSLTPRIALQAVVPLAFREVELELHDLVVSEDEVLAGVRRSLDSWGLLDPTLAAAYRFYSSASFDVYADAGTRVPLDDNPESLTFPARVPLSTGQNEFFVGAGANQRSGAFAVSLAYRFSYFPGSTASYLIRRFGEQSYTNGALSWHLRHGVRAALDVALTPAWSLQLVPEWSALRLPELVEEGGATRRFLAEDFRVELSTRFSVRLRLDHQHALEAFYEHSFLAPHQDDPFFPIVLPRQGFGIAWRVWSR